MGYMGRVQQQETSAEYDVGGRKSPPTQARRRREGTELDKHKWLGVWVVAVDDPEGH